MSTAKKNLPLTTPRLYDYGGDLSKHWYILYKDSRGKRHKIQKGINIYNTVSGRTKAAKLLIDELVSRKKAIKQGIQRKHIMAYLEMRKPSWESATYKSNTSRVRVFLDWLGDREVNRQTIHSFFSDHLMKRAGKTYNGYKVVLRQILVNSLNIDPIIFADIERRKNSSNTAMFFTQVQKDFIANYLLEHDVQLWLAIQFVYYGFIRPRRELRRLKVSDIFWDDNNICVHGSESKNDKTRFIQIPPPFKKALEEHVKGRPPMEYIFHSKEDPYKMIAYNTLGGRHFKLLQKFNFDTNRYKMYGWKNTGMVEAIKAGFSLKWIQLQAGHHSLEQTNQYLTKIGFVHLDEDLTKFPSF